MQIWLFFQAGVGGDGVANLFERSRNVTPIDGVTDYWRIHRIVDSSIKFYAPNIDSVGCFRYNQPFKLINNELASGYLDIINQNHNCIVTSHDTSLDLLFASDCQDLLLKNQIKVLLTSNNTEINFTKALTKNLCPVMYPMSSTTFCPEKFDHVLDADLIKTDWNYVNNFCKNVGIELDHAEYIQYCDLIKGNKTFMANNFNVEEWASNINGTKITYNLIDTWQPI